MTVKGGGPLFVPRGPDGTRPGRGTLLTILYTPVYTGLGTSSFLTPPLSFPVDRGPGRTVLLQQNPTPPLGPSQRMGVWEPGQPLALSDPCLSYIT